MTSIGYALSSEEHAPNDLVRYAARAEECGFDFAMISDHYHPWIDRQGQSSFVWSVIGGIAHATERLRIGTGVTCPTIRIHPAVIAQAAATAACMMPGRFMLGVGTGENLNEHITGERWPSADERRDMLAEAVDIIRELWEGELTDYRGAYYQVEGARIYTLPDQLPPVLIAGSGRMAAELAAEIGDGFIGTSPDADSVGTFTSLAHGEPAFGQVTVCWAEQEPAARRIAREVWPNSGVPGELSVELPLPRHFEQASRNVTEEAVAERVVCGPDPAKHVEAIRRYADAGYDHVYVHQVGPDQEGFFRFYERDVLPELRRGAERRRESA